MLRFALTVQAVAWVSGPCLAGAAATRTSRSPDLVPTQGPSVLTSSASGVRFKAGAGPDTFCLYGGPNNPTEGKFQDVGGAPGILGHAPHAIVEGEWYGVDLTDESTSWQVSGFPNPANLATPRA